MLIGHLASGAMAVDRAARRLGTPQETAMLVEHMLLSHHGDPEFGAAVRPMFLEAELLSELDLMDARIYEMAQAVQTTQPNGFSPRQWALDNRKLYNHARREVAPRAMLQKLEAAWITAKANASTGGNRRSSLSCCCLGT